ncbi:MAG: cytochrome c oxidase subunit II [Alphaproteobacteria bacterium]|nr:cytochrome c oxidase subunit II [Alphaproteobacteria bacterium]
MRIFKWLSTVMASAITVLSGGLAFAAQPTPWQMGFQPAASPVMERVDGFHDFLLVVITLISVFVLALMIYVFIKFNAKANPTPSRTTHNTTIEVLWTVIPIIILVVIAVPSFKLMYYSDRAVDPDMTLKVVGNQFFWTYEYPDNDDLTFDAILVDDADLKDGDLRLLTTDNAVVLPIDTTIRLLMTANDVIHAWAVPAFGVKMDAVPGRLNETWFRIDKEGTYYGQCSELCGSNHGFMPIMVKAVSKDEFAAWVEKAKKEFAGNTDPDPTRVASIGVRAE